MTDCKANTIKAELITHVEIRCLVSILDVCAATTSYAGNPAKHSPPVVQAAQAQATSYTSSASTGNQLYRQRKHRQPVIHAAQAHAMQAQATSYTGSPNAYNQLSSGLFFTLLMERQAPDLHPSSTV